MIKVGDVIAVEFDTEICCEQCMEAIHFHFSDNCPVCGSLYAGATDYDCPGGAYDCFRDADGLFSCEDCGSRFKMLTYDCGEGSVEVLEVGIG